jgi:hypothetical protein
MNILYSSEYQKSSTQRCGQSKCIYPSNKVYDENRNLQLVLTLWPVAIIVPDPACLVGLNPYILFSCSM